jgi:hypothetical protein
LWPMRPRRPGERHAKAQKKSPGLPGNGYDRAALSLTKIEVVMALGIYFASKSFSVQQYDDAISRLEAAGAGSPAGRSFHCAFSGENGLDVFDVWESQEAFEKFGETLMPILGQLGADPGEPMVAEIHNVIKG